MILPRLHICISVIKKTKIKTSPVLLFQIIHKLELKRAFLYMCVREMGAIFALET